MKPFPIHWNHHPSGCVWINIFLLEMACPTFFFQFHPLIRRNSVASSVPELMSSCHRLLGLSDLCSCAPRRSLRNSLHQWYQKYVGLGSSLVGMQHHGKVIKTYNLSTSSTSATTTLHSNVCQPEWLPQPGSWTLISWSWWRCWPGIKAIFRYPCKWEMLEICEG